MRPHRLPLAALTAANAVSLTGNVLASVAIPWFVLETTGSPALTGVAGFAATAPFAIGSLLAGRVVDALGLRRASVVADVVSGATIAAIPLLHALGRLDLPILLALTFAGGLLDAVGAASRQSLLPELAEDAGTPLERANGIYGGTEHLGYLLGAPLAGVLIVLLGAPAVLWLDAASFGVAAALVALTPRRGGRERATPAVPVDLRGALRWIRSDPIVLAIAVFSTLGSVLINPLAPVILPVYANSVAGTPVALGAGVAAYGIGGLAGTAAFAWRGSRLSRSPVYLAGWIVAPLLFGALVPLPPLVPVLGVVFAIGFVAGVIAPLEITVRQERVPPSLLPRVVGLMTAAWMIAGPVSVLVTGVAIEAIGLGMTLAAVTAGWAVLALAVALTPASRRLDESRSRREAASA